LLIKLTESYNSGNKKELKDLIKKLKSNNNLVEVYRFYEDMEKTYIQNKETAKVFVETLEPHFIEKIKSIDSECKKFSKVLKDVVVENNELYECLDVLSEENTIHNIVKKIEYKEKWTLLDRLNPRYIVLKPALHGGILGCEEWIFIANHMKIGWWVTSALESNIGLNAIAQWCSKYEKCYEIPQGLGTGQLYANNFPTNLFIENYKLYIQK
jgi:O-succinylbenzoate synthase